MDNLRLGDVQPLDLGLCEKTYRAGVIHDGHCFFYAFLIATAPDPQVYINMPKPDFTKKVIAFRKSLRSLIEKEIEKATSPGRGKKNPIYKDLSTFLVDNDVERFLDYVEGKRGTGEGNNIWAGEEIWTILQDLFSCKIYVFLNKRGHIKLYCRTYERAFLEQKEKIYAFYNISETYYEPILFKTKKGETRGEINRRSCLYDDIQKIVIEQCINKVSTSPSSSVGNSASKSASSSSNKNDSVHQLVQRMNLRKGSPVNIPSLGWIPPESTSFNQWINDDFKQISKLNPNDIDVDNSQFHPQIYQLIVRDYLQYTSPYRGLLIYHGLGTGKTCTSIGIAELLSQQRNVTVMLEARLHGNYIYELQKCGHGSYISQQAWKFVNMRSNDPSIKDFPNLDKDVVNRNNGVWVSLGPSKTLASPISKSELDEGFRPWEKLTSIEQEQINTQIRTMLEKRYTFLHYNGVDSKKLNDLTKSGKVNPFDNQVVIIDEVHNFISRVVNKVGMRYDKTPVSGELYNLLLNAKNVRIVMLSGTPILNHPFELAYMINLLAGWKITYHLMFKSTHIPNNISKFLKENTRIYNINNEANEITFQITPVGFSVNNKNLWEFSSKDNIELQAQPTDIFQGIVKLVKKEDSKLAKNDRIFKGDKQTNHHVLPTTRDEFDGKYINYKTFDVVHKDEFMKAAQGRISYFENLDSTQFPKVNFIKYENVPMTDHQFGLYSAKRKEEIELEMRKPTKSTNLYDAESSQVYKAFSRALCNFAFPDDIKRPYVKDKKMEMEGDIVFTNGEVDVDEQFVRFDDDEMVDINEPKKKVKEVDRKKLLKMYESDIYKALGQLRSQGDVFLGKDLYKYSPKMTLILKRITEQEGKALVYSQFRTMEGLGIFSVVLDTNGWQRIDLLKDKSGWRLTSLKQNKPGYIVFGSDQEVNEILLNIYNSDLHLLPQSIREDVSKLSTTNIRGEVAKLLMISRAGAEGINTKGCRSVHIMEPYWNSIRISQVIGRAVRMKSHESLPLAERNVSIYIYMATCTKEQLKKNFTIRRKDDGKTTDEFIFAIADKKNNINGQFLTLLKRSAIDCAIHRHEGIECYDPLTTSSELSVQNKQKNKKTKKPTTINGVGVQRVVIKGKPYLMIGEKHELFDYMEYLRSGVLLSIGHLKAIDDNIYMIHKTH